MVQEGKLTIENKITPDGLDIDVSSISIKRNILEISFSFLANRNIKFLIKLFIFFCFKKDIAYLQTEKIETPATNGLYTIGISLSSEIKKAIRKNSKPLIYFAVSGAPINNKKVNWTSTFVKQM